MKICFKQMQKYGCNYCKHAKLSRSELATDCPYSECKYKATLEKYGSYANYDQIMSNECKALIKFLERKEQ